MLCFDASERATVGRSLTGGPRRIWLGQAIAIELAEPYIAEDDAHATRWP
jgi:hypothetical protein